MPVPRMYRAGQSIEDYCRACKTDRMHTVIAVDSSGQPIRVACDYCRSEHNYRGGPRIASSDEARVASPRRGTDGRPTIQASAALPLVTDRERIGTPMPADNAIDLEMLLRRVIREESGLSPAAPAEKWRGGTMILRPGKAGLQEKSWPIETFFHKVVMLRNRLRTLEQQVNASELPEDAKIKLQGYITGCYGSLTSFNVLFADADDQFKGTEND